MYIVLLNLYKNLSVISTVDMLKKKKKKASMTKIPNVTSK